MHKLYLAAPLSGIVDECSSPTAGEGGGVKKKLIGLILDGPKIYT
jgi:hypothetical protein